jgi:hypothetical protein
MFTCSCQVATTLYTDFSPSLLAIPLVAVAQILLGAGMGRVAAHFAYRQPVLVPAHFAEHQPTRASSVVAGKDTATFTSRAVRGRTAVKKLRSSSAVLRAPERQTNTTSLLLAGEERLMFFRSAIVREHFIFGSAIVGERLLSWFDWLSILSARSC